MMSEHEQEPVGWDGGDDVDDREAPREWLDVCADILGASGYVVVAASPEHRDSRRILFASDRTATRVADLSYVLGASPHAQAMAENSSCALDVTDRDHGHRWPLLIDELVALDVARVHALPIGRSGLPLGTVQFLWRTDAPIRRSPEFTAFAEHLVRMVGADLVLAGLGAGASPSDVDTSATNVAIGVLLARHAVSPDTASAMLRAGAYARGHSADAEARRILDTIGETESE